MKEDIQKTFQLFRMYDKNHIICNSPLKYRQAYYFALKNLTEKACNIPSYKAFFKSLKQLFSLSDDHTQQAVDKVFLILNKVYTKREAGFFGLFKKPEYSHKYIYNLIIEAGYINALLTEFHINTWLTSIEEQVKLNENELVWFQEYLSILLSENTKLLLKHTDTEINFLKETVSQITKHIISEQEYQKLPVYNIAVVAVISAGKSTFINALLGNELFPEANAACTAKITSVYDNDSFNHITGLVMKKGKIISALNNLDNNDLIRWNGDVNIDRIILEGNLDNITNSKKIVAVHDTLGTNFSGDETHKKITINFLENSNLEIILCLLNAEHLATNDEAIVLKELQQIRKKSEKLKIIFIINKIDVFDNEKESLIKTIEKIKYNLSKYDFNNYDVIPISAKAARLFKMALTGKNNRFTENEIDSFRKMFRKFSGNWLADTIAVNSDNFLSDKYLSDEKIEIDNTEYLLNDIQKALYNTGFINIEKIIENQLINADGGKR